MKLGYFISTIAVGVAANALPANAQNPAGETWKAYRDSLGSSLDVPSSLRRVKPADPSNTLEFRSIDGQTSVWFRTGTESRPGFPGDDPTDISPTINDCDHLPPAYQVSNDKVTAFSCRKGTKIVYSVERFSEWGAITLNISYPISQKSYWDHVVGRMAGSMTQIARRGCIVNGC